ncbi:thiamine phosphate synthase [Rhizorhabdus dicambivorans]|uniref:Thiamine phosphate synthase n=1 Tax=Rhizorhabdus dicambivorans TaxID=1850238 RepID=A0A2A4G115_9SPHN|nr:thiamine phosphate synthase [Rhizorhabdus dicambivorans]ATE67076.1 thiamine phosphate synthase [Rhizorhabdus dicambivorans]PCE43699.1 thiamine phosphate synthase [Rhizorhabdus dicambivorans]
MHARHPELPRLWLMTDERQGDGLFAAIRRLPPGSGIIFRHKGTAGKQRRVLFERVKRLARRRGLVVLLAAGPAKARRWGADGAHHRRPGPPRYGTAAAHDLHEIRAAERSGAMAILLSPLHPTRSHPHAPALGRMRFAALVRSTGLPVIALGGIDAKRGAMAMRAGAWGWAAIDAWGG